MNSRNAQEQRHRKKKYVYKIPDAPFPVPIASITREAPSKNYWHHYTGEIQGDFVLVKHSGDISYLNNMGFFGRGLMSRGDPSLYKDLPCVHLPSGKDSEPDVVPVMRRRMFLKHMKWKKSHDLRLTNEEAGGSTDRLSDASEDQEFDSDIEWNQQDSVHAGNPKFNVLPPETSHSKNTETGTNYNDSSGVEYSDILKQQNNTSANQNSSVWSWDQEMTNRKLPVDSWENTSATQKSAADSWDMMEADEDFWASEDVQSETSKTKDSVPPDSVKTKSNHTEILRVGNIKEKRNPVDSEESPIPPMKRVKMCCESDINSNKEDPSCVSNANTDQENENESQFHKSHNATDKAETEKVSKDQTDIGKVAKASESSDKKGNEILEKTEEKMQISESEEWNSAITASKGRDEAVRESRNVCDNPNNDLHTALPVHPYCTSDTEGNDTDVEDFDEKTAVEGCEYLVIDDSDIDDSIEPVHRKDKYTWLPLRKKEIFNFNEPLVLSFEEAYFLSYGLGCLTVKDENQTSLTLTDLWCRFCTKPQFLSRYVAYHYFRSKGWVPKPSILFATDFVIYKVGPAFYHASYSVIVKTVYSDTFEEVPNSNMKFTWTSFFGLNRITEHVSKTLLYCYVIMPRDLSEEEKKSPECISRFKIRLQTVKRWVASQEREKDKGVEDIT